MRLLDIQPIVQSIADAIATVLKLEVEIADIDFVRIACTGKMQIDILKKLEGNLVYKTVLETREPIIITNPGFEPVCERCPFFQNCIEVGEISAPIFLQDKIIGFIGLMAIEHNQKERLFQDIEGILSFLNKMADLLASKLQQSMIVEQLQVHTTKMEQILNLVNYGVLIIDEKGNIKQKNEQASTILNIENQNKVSSIEYKWISNLLSMGEFDTKNFIIQTRPVEKSIFVSKKLLTKNNNKIEYLITIQDASLIKKIADDVYSENMRLLDDIVGSSQQIKELKEYSLAVSQSKSSILIQGESGTGKEVFAKAIHKVSNRGNKSFIAVNSGAIPEHLLESELFGYEKGAFTGANNTGKVGKFELANGGTIFLDEIGEMPLHLQVKILRVLQENEIERIGSTKVIPIDVRVIAATNKDLKTMVNDGCFREDLYYRLNVIPLYIPPLRSRKEDIPTLIRHFIEDYNNVFHKKIKAFNQDLMDLLMDYPWKGNVRELKNFIEYLFNFAEDGIISLENSRVIIEKKIKLEEKNENNSDEIFSLKRHERDLIYRAVDYVKQRNLKIEAAAELLGIGRATLFRKLKEYQNEI